MNKKSVEEINNLEENAKTAIFEFAIGCIIFILSVLFFFIYGFCFKREIFFHGMGFLLGVIFSEAIVLLRIGLPETNKSVNKFYQALSDNYGTGEVIDIQKTSQNKISELFEKYANDIDN